MLLEPGPISLFVDAEIPRPGQRGTFERFTAQEASTLTDAAAAAGVAAGQLAPVLGAAGDLRAASDLAAAVSEHDRQSRESDSEIASVAAGAGALESQLAGLTNELAGELANASMPEEPDAPDAGENEDWKDPEYKDIIREWFLKYLGRDVDEDYLDELRDQRQPFVAVLAGILASEEYLERQRQGLVSGLKLPAPSQPSERYLTPDEAREAGVPYKPRPGQRDDGGGSSGDGYLTPDEAAERGVPWVPKPEGE